MFIFLKHWRLRCCLAGILGVLSSLSAQAIELGDNVSDFEIPGFSQAQSLSDLKGKWIYLDFWASWCVPCRQSFPFMNDMHLKLQGKNIQIIAVNVDVKKNDAERFLIQNPAKFALSFDPKGELARKMNLKSMPTSYLINPQGKVVFIHAGFRNEDKKLLENKLLAEVKD
jgi:cytochrome c biogenesis protein CcmG, thiol:disulfide interchange protein DsbE